MFALIALFGGFGFIGRILGGLAVGAAVYAIIKSVLADQRQQGGGMGWTAEEARRAAAQDAARASFQSGSRSQSPETHQTAARSDRVAPAPSQAGSAPSAPSRAQAAGTASETASAPARKKPQYPPEVQKIVDEGKKAKKELSRLYAVIPDLEVKHKVEELIDVAGKIIDDAKEDPTDVPQIQKFLDYYLPTTIKLLKSYERMSAQGISGENIDRSMENIKEMLDTTVEAYKKLLDSLFANQALDIETDIQVMNTLLKREGLTSSGGSAFQFDVQ